VTKKVHAVGNVVGGRYEIRATVGKRPLGMMYRAFDREVEVEVALRVLSAELLPDDPARQAFAQRISRARGLQHPNLMRFHGVAVDGEEVAVAVQWAPGKPLKGTIPPKGMPAAEARPILAQVAAGMQHAHSQGLVLGDVRPETVIVYADGIKLSNIGIGLALPRRTFLEAMQGTPGHAYLAPELRAGRLAETRADVFSLAVLTVELLTAQPLQAGARISLQTLAVLPPALGPALSRALAEDPLVRQSSVDALAREIEVILSTGAAPRPRRVSVPPVSGELTLPDAKPRGFGPPTDDHETRQVSEDELREIQGQEVTRRVHEDEILPLRIASSDDPILEMEMEAEFEAETTLDGEDHEHDTERVMLLDADAIKTEPVAKVEADDEEEDKETVRVEKIDPDEPVNGVVSSAPPPKQPPPQRETAPPPPRPPPRPLDSLPKIEVVGLPVEARSPSPARGAPILKAPSPPRGAPVVRAASPPRGVPVVPAELPPPVLPELPPAVEARPRHGRSTVPVPPLVDLPQRRSRKGVIAGVAVIVAFAAVLAAVVLSIADHLREVRLTQERASKQRLAEELNARADAMRRASAPPKAAAKAAQPKAPQPAAPVQATAPVVARAAEPALAPVAAPFSNRCPLGANLVEGPHRYCIDVYEYPGGKTIPRTAISFEEAGRLCASRGERLCTGDEWERACRGRSGASYPYGQSFDPTRCNTRGSGGEMAPAGSFADCKSASGAYDMSGNVSEWVAGPHGPQQRGGSFLSTNPQTRCSNVIHGAPESGSHYVGFRCCSDPK
jgi:serine/threonine protein kinase